MLPWGITLVSPRGHQHPGDQQGELRVITFRHLTPQDFVCAEDIDVTEGGTTRYRMEGERREHGLRALRRS